jgi:uncharacterized repeat protein (TIGR03803 family)
MSLKKTNTLPILPSNAFCAACVFMGAFLTSMVSASGQNYIYQQLYAFGDNTIGYARNTNGYAPEGALVQGTDGNFYGTCAEGGQPTTNNPAGGYGTAFSMTPNGALTTIAWFNGTSGNGLTNYGEHPFGSMLQATDGAFYGTSEEGFFKVSSAGTLIGLGSGNGIVGDPVQGSDGYLYGGSGSYAFRTSLDGHSGESWYLAASASGGLIQASDGNFYGLTSDGGNSGFGTAYKVTPQGVLTTLVSFGGTNIGRWPYGKMLQASDGNLYGVCDSPEQVFKLTLGGTLTTLAVFGTNENSGSNPNGGLIEANDGNFYGTCAYGGISSEGVGNMGTVFKITPQGNITTLFAFSGQSGSCPGQTPLAGLVQGSDGNLYGACAYGGDYGGGNIFRIIMPGPHLSLSHIADKAVLTWRTNYVGYTLQTSDGLNPPNWIDCTNSPAVLNGCYCLTNAPSNGNGLFRLRK